MKLSEIKEWLAIFICVLIVLGLFGWFIRFAQEEQARKEELKIENPVQYAQENSCRSKITGSTPVCWTEEDWEVFCRKVQCK